MVIIGLIVGGVLAGQNLIASANVRKQISQVTTLETQIATFRGKFDCLPGDCANATALLGTTFGSYTILNGDNDGLIRAIAGGGGPYSSPECLQGGAGDELPQLFVQLNAAGMGSYSFNLGVNEPETALASGTVMFVSCLTSVAHPNIAPSFLGVGNIILIGGETGGGARIGYAAGLYSWNYGGGIMGIQQNYAQAIDQKIDDGLPTSGIFGVVSSSPSNAASCSTGSNTYPTAVNNCSVVAGKVIKSF